MRLFSRLAIAYNLYIYDIKLRIYIYYCVAKRSFVSLIFYEVRLICKCSMAGMLGSTNRFSLSKLSCQPK